MKSKSGVFLMDGGSNSSGLGQNTAIRETLASMNVASEAAPCEVQRVTDVTLGENGMQAGKSRLIHQMDCQWFPQCSATPF